LLEGLALVADNAIANHDLHQARVPYARSTDQQQRPDIRRTPAAHGPDSPRRNGQLLAASRRARRVVHRTNRRYDPTVTKNDAQRDNDTPRGLARGAALSQPRVISAGDTFFAKFVFSPVLLSGAVVLVIVTLRDRAHAHEHAISWWGIAFYWACIGLFVSMVWPLARMKRVALSKTSLHVSNFLREIVVPLNDISTVREIEGTAYRVCIEFKSETPFGRQIRFSVAASPTSDRRRAPRGRDGVGPSAT
jgi:hypothetical protein